jgi:hypothetical protein
MGVYYEAKLDKNEGKTLEEIKDMVYKNLAKDPIYYTKNGQFGVDVGYTDEAPSLGATDEPKGKYKSSGYGNLKEHSISAAGGLVTGHVFSSRDYKDFFGLSEETKIPSEEEIKDSEKALQDLANTYEKVSGMFGKSNESLEEVKMASEEKAEALLRAAEEYLKEVDTIDDVIYFIEANLETQESDI